MQDTVFAITEDDLRQAVLESKSLASHGNPVHIGAAIGGSKTFERKKKVLARGKALGGLRSHYRDMLRNVLASRKSKLSDLRERSREVFRESFTEAFIIGLRASGVGARKDKADIQRAFKAEDRRWIREMADEELGFWMKFLNGVRAGDVSGAVIDHRLQMYAQGITGVYNSGRVAGLPEDSLIYWTGKRDDDKCESCWYLMNQNPYTRHNLPTVPRAGDTLCLSNCRDRLAVKRSNLTEMEDVLKQRPTKAQHLQRLRQIKENRKQRRWTPKKYL